MTNILNIMNAAGLVMQGTRAVVNILLTAIILGMGSANERRPFYLIGQALI